MAQEDVEKQFNPRAAVPSEDLDNYSRWAVATSAATRSEWEARHGKPCVIDVRYGDSALSTLDIFPAAEPNSPVHVFLHGGFWRARDKSDYSYVAEALAKHGITTLVMNYDLCPKVRLDEIVQQVKKGFLWVQANARDFGCQPELFTASGHSAGAHLIAAVLADANHQAMPNGALLISGIYELEPVLHISVNAEIQLKSEMVDALSPMRHPPAHPCRIAVAAGGAEPDGWVAQSRDYAKVCRAAGADCIYIEMPGDHHYSVMSHLVSPDGWFSRTVASLCRHVSVSPTT